MSGSAATTAKAVGAIGSAHLSSALLATVVGGVALGGLILLGMHMALKRDNRSREETAFRKRMNRHMDAIETAAGN